MALIVFNAYGQSVIEPCKQGPALLTALSSAYTPTLTLGYSNARDTMYAVLDDDGSHEIYCLYTQFSVTRDPNIDPSISVYQNGAGINAEHIFPQSKGAGSEPAKSDLHNLASVKGNVNSSRGNCPFGEIDDDTETDTWYHLTNSTTTKPTTNIDSYSEKENDNGCAFEPREDAKGDIARAVFYFYTIYKTEADASDATFFDGMKDDLLQWHYDDPVDAAELARMNKIAGYQSNTNPFVLDSSLARRAYFLPNASYSSGSANCYGTSGSGGGVAGNSVDSVLIVEVADPSDVWQARFVTIQNRSTLEVDISNWEIRKYTNGATSTSSPEIIDAGTILQPNEKVIIARNITDFTNAYGVAPGLENGTMVNGNGDDAYSLADSDGNNVDFYGVVGTDGSGENWEYENDFIQRKATVFESNTIFNINEWDIHTNYSAAQIAALSTSLPAELIDFRGKATDKNVNLYWTTVSEENNDYFEIERSVNGFAFESIGIVNGSGTITAVQNYLFIDKNPLNGANYYRLRQVDFDGNYEYSKIVLIDTETNIPTIKIVQNPVEDKLLIETNTITNSDIQFEIFNISGQLMKSINLENTSNRMIIVVEDLSSGMYFIKINNGNEATVKRFIKK